MYDDVRMGSRYYYLGMPDAREKKRPVVPQVFCATLPYICGPNIGLEHRLAQIFDDAKERKSGYCCLQSHIYVRSSRLQPKAGIWSKKYDKRVLA